MSLGDKWDRIYAAAAGGGEPAWSLAQHRHLLPVQGVALDFACGFGANALLLAAHELETHAWDISGQALARLNEAAEAEGLTVTTLCRDVEAEPPPVAGFDVIVVSRFLHRPTAPALVAALKPGGLLFYETFTREKPDGVGPSNPDYLLKPGELLELFAYLHPLVYRDEGRVGDLEQGWRSYACLVAQSR